MAIENFELRPETGAPLERELWLSAGAGINYEVAAERKQRGLLVASRAVSSSVTAKEITRGFVLDVSQVDEAAMWVRDFPVVRLQIPADLTPVFDTIELGFYASDPEGNAFGIQTGTVPAPLTALFGVADNAQDLTITYPAVQANPASNQSFVIPVFLEQPLGTKVAGSDRSLMVSVLRFAPEPIHTTYFSPAAAGRLYIDAGASEFNVTLNGWIQNHSSRPLILDNGTDGTTSWNTTTATYTLGVSNGVWSFRGVRASGFTGPTQTNPVQIRVRTNDNGDTSTAYLNFLVRVEPAAS